MNEQKDILKEFERNEHAWHDTFLGFVYIMLTVVPMLIAYIIYKIFTFIKPDQDWTIYIGKNRDHPPAK